MRHPPVPNRLAVVPQDLYDRLEQVIANERGYSREVQVKMLKNAVGMAYRSGYMDGYRDGHTDAENGHDERISVCLN